jgi:SAM-dependent methyltransferase
MRHRVAVMREPRYWEVRRFRAEVTQKFLEYPLTTDRDGLICSRILPVHRDVLEIGAGERPFVEELKVRGFEGTFKTMDPDPRLPVDYHSIDEVRGAFDAVVMREVIEHVPREQCFVYLERIFELLRPGGMFAITTPNPWSPGWALADYTHVAPWPPADLYAVLRCQGFFPVEIHRVIWPSRFLWLKRLYWSVHSRLYDIDYAGSYVALARKPGNPAPG